MNYTKKLTVCVAAAVSCTLGFASTASAQLITWEPSVNMYAGETVQTFVDTTGNLAVGYNASGDTEVNIDTGIPNANVTVNGVPFIGTLNGTVLGGTGTETILINTDGDDNVGSFQDGEFTSDGDIFHLIRGATLDVNSITLGGLEIGQDYLVQVFTNDARGNRSELFVTGFGDGSGSTEPVGISNLNNSPVDGSAPVLPQSEVGDSIIGTFTPTSDSLTFNVFGSNSDPALFTQGDGRAQINALQLRRVEEVIGIPGDYNGDMEVNAEDIDLLSAQLGNPASVNPLMNLDSDDTITLADHDLHITTLVQDANGTGALIGDLNLDGDVDVSQISVGPTGVVNVGDASVLLAGLGTTTGAGYADGDLNGDGDIDVSQISVGPTGVTNVGDASILLANLGQSTIPQGAPAASAVPEPGSLTILALAGIVCRLRRQK